MQRAEVSVQPLVERLWVRLPLAARRLSMTPAHILVDGLYLTVWPRVAAFAPIVVFVGGLLIGWLHPGFATVFSESLPVILLATVLGVTSGHLGAMFVAGFVLGDFFLAHTMWTAPGGLISHLLRVRVPLLIQYGLLALLTTSIPIITKGLLAQLTPPAALGRPLRLGIAVLGHAALTFVLVFLWTQIVPILIRPVFTWQGRPPPVAAMAPLQTQSIVIVATAVLASLTRLGLQALTASTPVYAETLDHLETKLASAEAVTPAVERVPSWALVTVTALWTTLMLAGMVQAWLDGILLFTVILALQSARAGLIPVPLGRWPELIERIPVLFRLAIGGALLYYLSEAVLRQQMRATNTFRPILVLTVLALLIFYLLNPGRPRVRRPAERRQDT